MSRSKRKPWYKDRGLSTHDYWSLIRHEWKQKIDYVFPKNTPFGLYWETFDVDDFELRNPKEIQNDYDYSDYCFFVYYNPRQLQGNGYWSGWEVEDVKKYSRK